MLTCFTGASPAASLQQQADLSRASITPTPPSLPNPPECKLSVAFILLYQLDFSGLCVCVSIIIHKLHKAGRA